MFELTSLRFFCFRMANKKRAMALSLLGDMMTSLLRNVLLVLRKLRRNCTSRIDDPTGAVRSRRNSKKKAEYRTVPSCLAAITAFQTGICGDEFVSDR